MTGRDPASPAWGADEDAVGQLPAGILCTAFCPHPAWEVKIKLKGREVWRQELAE